ncbi:DUF808 domain-containing protein [Vibrio renipiscarius]|uniref:Membrane protein n=1 Tax=Vibrio renipiscarius TaxID=1461322 RepID=A0A0C2JQ75_9VIBR|nr:DUF808 domain-containing protein [Vibrio renipiscarius]KII80219.1 membrane protein [Vibrio renipiscarius]KII82061.1 membrane protein [Vibrio renipiscarius]
MAGLSLLTLLDDIATVLDDVALMSKVAAKKTAGVLGDDLALNAQQVSGVRAEREIPVVWSVAKGSFKNKLILVPAALLISSIAPWLITPLLLVGGLFLCFEGAEKVHEKLFHPHSDAEPTDNSDLSADNLADYEQQKIKGAIRTDFILSAEIIVIALGTVQGHPFITQVLVMSLIAVLMTIGVYGLVAGIVKMDDLGFYLQRKSQGEGALSLLGDGLVSMAPKLMKFLTVVGTIAMFLVGGGIIVHSLSFIHHGLESVVSVLPQIPYLSATYSTIGNGIIGLMSGLLMLALLSGYRRLRATH